MQEDRQKRLGPGGLDPVEVFESLPPVSMLSSVATDRAYSCLGDRRLDFCRSRVLPNGIDPTVIGTA